MNSPHRIAHNELDNITRILADTKKVISYNKGGGLWSWVNKDEIEVSEAYHVGFKTWLDAAKDAVEPYLESEE